MAKATRATKSKFQKFEASDIPRSRIKNADYNPRTIGDDEKERLQKSLEELGLVEALVWNKRSGNLVAGHQRLAILDDIEPSPDYILTLSVVDVDEQTERRMNVVLNNPSMQGEFDGDMLAELLNSTGLELGDYGFTEADVLALCGEAAVDLMGVEEDESTLEDIETIRELKGARKEGIEKAAERDDTEFYVVAVFPSRSECDAFLGGIGATLDQRYISGVELMKRLGIPAEQVEFAVSGLEPDAPSVGEDKAEA